MPERRLAVVDLGSNSFRLVVFTARDGWWKRTDEIYEAVRIGEGLAATGELGERGMARAQATMEVFAHFCQASGLSSDEVDAVATSAIRDATNSEEFLRRATAASGLKVRTLSLEEEARYGYLAAVNSTTLSDGVMLDLGGGSMQLVHVVGRRASELDSWRMGAVRMSERFLPGDGPAKPRQLKELRAHVARKLERAPWLSSCGPRLVGIGGTVRNLAAAAQRDLEVAEFGVQGYVLTRAELDRLVEELAARSPAERAKLPGIKPSRADLILAGAVVVAGVMEAGGFEGMEVTEAGLREGVFFERHLDGDPPLFEDVRRASVINLAAQYGMDPGSSPHTAHVAHLALGLFDELAAAGLHPGDAVERELLWAACLLHDIGMTVDYDDHHKHSRYLVLNAGLPGFEQREAALIGQAVRYHRKGSPSLGPFATLAARGDDQRLARMATLLRLAEDLERSRDQLVREAHVAVEDGQVRLELVSDGDTRVSRWAAGREVELFASAFDRRLAI
ncbi:MAG: exopolyphosphatase / guanosine-5-triphosphate,3-diphosphate pyrophosphatase [Solirubrobacteraceae bacterium]|jgi:exopolyphosphatase/guanosine-5'-triphosphate,3'-diphosphate pyrophosphatase|nr:exopolyphosphatase / guanosine-5-triphosphate,3-diphosphate pyrophosphatase [Solirubrobacteraceae bacterium]